MSFAIDPVGTMAVFGTATQTLAPKAQASANISSQQNTATTETNAASATNGGLTALSNATGTLLATNGTQTDENAQGGDTAFSRYTEQYRRLSAIVLDKDGRYDKQAQIRAYMELQSMASSGKLKGMEADDQRLWMQISNSSVSLLQQTDDSSSDTSSTASTADTSSAITPLFSGAGVSTVQADENQTTGTKNGAGTDASAASRTGSNSGLLIPLQRALSQSDSEEQQTIGQLISLSA